MRIDRGERKPQPIVGIRERVAMADMSAFFERAFTEAWAALGQQGIAPAGPPIALYAEATADEAEVTAGFPVGAPVTPTGVLVAATLPGGSTIEATHVGSYDRLTDSYTSIMGWCEAEGIAPSAQMWEEYLVGPESGADPSRWQTRIVFPVG